MARFFSSWGVLSVVLSSWEIDPTLFFALLHIMSLFCLIRLKSPTPDYHWLLPLMFILIMSSKHHLQVFLSIPACLFTSDALLTPSGHLPPSWCAHTISVLASSAHSTYPPYHTFLLPCLIPISHFTCLVYLSIPYPLHLLFVDCVCSSNTEHYLKLHGHVACFLLLLKLSLPHRMEITTQGCGKLFDPTRIGLEWIGHFCRRLEWRPS